MNWQEYEKVSKKITEIAIINNCNIECFGNKCKRKGFSDVYHQIDVLASYLQNGEKYITAIECKHLEEKVNKDVVMKLKCIIDDCCFNKGIIISKNGFTPDAIKYAKNVSIGLVELREFTDKDWEGRVKKIDIELKMFVFKVIKYENIIKKEYKKLKDNNVENNKYYYELPDKKKITINEILKELEGKLSFENPKDFLEKNFPENTFFKDINNDIYHEVSGIKISGELTTNSTTSLKINGEDYLWLIIKEIFEKKTMSVSYNWEINEI